MPQLVIAPLAGALGIASGTLGFSLLSAGVNLAFGLAANALFAPDVPAAEAQKLDLGFAATLPAKRFVYGYTRAVATPLPHPVVGEYGYGVYLLNSRPSDGTPSIYLFGQEVPLSGDPYDFAGSGATPVSGDYQGHLQVWIGLGDQSGPPAEYVAGAPYDAATEPLGFQASDAGAGSTIVFLKYKAGSNSTLSQRWPSVPPALQVEGLRTKVYDPRKVGHDPVDESTWEGTSTAALNTLDAVRKNLFRPYTDSALIMDMWAEVADIDEETVALAAGGTEQRYTVDGTVIFDGTELEAVLSPLFAAGAASEIWVGGRLGISGGEAPTSVMTLDDMLDGLKFSNMSPSADLPTEFRTSYVSAARGYDTAELAPYAVPGAGANEPTNPRRQTLPYTTSATRAMRLRQIAAYGSRQQRTLRGELPPAALDLVRMSALTVALGTAWETRVNGSYVVEGLHPAADMMGDGGVAMRIPAVLRGYDPAAWVWSTAYEEPVFDPQYEPGSEAVQVPGSLTVVTGATVNLETGGGITPRARVYGSPSPSAGVAFYEWQTAVSSSGEWTLASGRVDAETLDGSGNVSVLISGSTQQSQDYRIRACVSETEKSEWVTVTGITFVVGITLDDPSFGTPSEVSPGTVQVDVTVPNDPDAKGVEVYSGPDANVSNAAHLETIYAGQNVSVTVDEPGLGSGVTRYYFARTFGDFGNVGNWVTSAPVTTA